MKSNNLIFMMRCFLRLAVSFACIYRGFSFSMIENNFLVACGDRSEASVQAVKEFIEKGINVLALTEGGESALHLSCIWNHAEKVSSLLAAGADPNARASQNRASLDMTPLTWCTYANHLDSVKAFLKDPRVNVNLIVRQENDEYITALDIAGKIGNSDISNVLVEAGAKKYSELLEDSRLTAGGADQLALLLPPANDGGEF